MPASSYGFESHLISLKIDSLNIMEASMPKIVTHFDDYNICEIPPELSGWLFK